MANEMALLAYNRALKLSKPGCAVLGVCFTGTLATSRPKRGDHSFSEAGGYPCFEISAVNADKPSLTVAEIKDRVKQFEVLGKMVIVSNQPFFYKKAELFPGSSFVIGADTAARLINPKYYEGSHKRMLELLGDCKRTGCKFLVGGRNVDGVFKVLDDLNIPDEINDMFISIPANTFRMDKSSTELRKNQGGAVS